MAKQRETERKFLEQLLDSSKIENYKLPVPVNAELRKYQQVSEILHVYLENVTSGLLYYQQVSKILHIYLGNVT